MRNHFEPAASHLVEVDPYRRSSQNNQINKPNANVSGLAFAGGRDTTGVDLRWYTKPEYAALTDDQRSELLAWQRSNEGKKDIRKQRKANHSLRFKDADKKKQYGGEKEG